MRPPRNPCAPHVWVRMFTGLNGDAYRCNKCLEVRHTSWGDPEAAPVAMPGHYKCVEHDRYNCAEDHPDV